MDDYEINTAYVCLHKKKIKNSIIELFVLKNFWN